MLEAETLGKMWRRQDADLTEDSTTRDIAKKQQQRHKRTIIFLLYSFLDLEWLFIRAVCSIQLLSSANLFNISSCIHCHLC